MFCSPAKLYMWRVAEDKFIFANHFLLSSLSPFSYLVIRISYFELQLMATDNQEFMVVGVLGPSGSGKSTILNEIYGFEPSTQG